jgi:hypothetical protein
MLSAYTSRMLVSAGSTRKIDLTNYVNHALIVVETTAPEGQLLSDRASLSCSPSSLFPTTSTSWPSSSIRLEK